MFSKIKRAIKSTVSFVVYAFDSVVDWFTNLVDHHPTLTAFFGGFALGEGFVHGLVTLITASMLFAQAPGFAMFLVFLGVLEMLIPLWMLTAWFRAYFAQL